MTWRGWMAFVALGIIWGVPYFFIKLALQEISPAGVACGRVVIGSLILLPIAWKRGALRAVLDHKLAIFALAMVEFVIPFLAISLAERWISSSLAGILIATVPLTVALLSRFFGVHERFGAWRLMGLVVGFIGVATLLGVGTVSGPLGWIGVGCMLFAVLGYAIGPLIIQRHLGELDPFGPVAASLVIATVVLLPAAPFAFPAHLPTPTVLWSIAILGAVCTALAMMLMFYLVSHAGAARASVITYINPLVATLLGGSLLHERLGIGGFTALALILLGSWLATRGSATHGAAQAATP